MFITISRTNRITGRKKFLRDRFIRGCEFSDFRSGGPIMYHDYYNGKCPIEVLEKEFNYSVSWFDSWLCVYKFEIANDHEVNIFCDDLSEI